MLARPARKKSLLGRARPGRVGPPGRTARFDDHLKKDLPRQKKQTQNTFSKNLSQIRTLRPRKPMTNFIKDIFHRKSARFTNEEHYLGVTLRFHPFIYHLIDYSEVVKT